MRRLRVEVDGREVAALRQGESVTVPLSTGVHTVIGRMDWTSTPAFDLSLADGQDVHLEVTLPFSALWNMLRRPRSALTIRSREAPTKH